MNTVTECPLCGLDTVHVVRTGDTYTAEDQNGNPVSIPENMLQIYRREPTVNEFSACPDEGITYAGFRQGSATYARVGSTHRT